MNYFRSQEILSLVIFFLKITKVPNLKSFSFTSVAVIYFVPANHFGFVMKM